MSIQEKFSGLNARMYAENFQDISHLGKWTLSSFKTKNDVSFLLDDSVNTYWQSDGDLPHYVEIQFSKLTTVSVVCIFEYAEEDDSYTPAALKLEAGLGKSKLRCVNSYTLPQYDGWVPLKVGQEKKGLQCMYLRITILKNLQHGKDSHVRGLRIFTYPGKTKAEEPFTRL